ncbi:hypothetical protein [Asticcacaulis sp. AND118]|uniref:hypothetical protein n=1 Tax=Asticcacaulis sp. AND118 TaxID=2840468 RepID=UPI001CFF82BE|nr:hypothetical protein [Asticcacaulis sp. AND118]UDF03777.1 hypothetical protein LH365_01675 [Asticcacaulis sp. AND118]
MPFDIVDDAALLKRLQAAAKVEMTPEEIRNQRVSFVFGNLPKNHPFTKHQVEQALERMDGKPA